MLNQHTPALTWVDSAQIMEQIPFLYIAAHSSSPRRLLPLQLRQNRRQIDLLLLSRRVLRSTRLRILVLLHALLILLHALLIRLLTLLRALRVLLLALLELLLHVLEEGWIDVCSIGSGRHWRGVVVAWRLWGLSLRWRVVAILEVVATKLVGLGLLCLRWLLQLWLI
jgi:hypothetical protein